MGEPVHPDLTVRFFFPPWMWVDGEKLMVTGGQLVSDPGQPKMTTHSDCLSGCHDTAEGAWHDFPCRHFLNAIRFDSDLLYDPTTGEMVPRSGAN